MTTHTSHSSQRRVRTLALAAAVCLAGTLAEAQTTPTRNNRNADFIVAVVNSELVTAVEVAQRVERAAAEAKRAGGTQPEAGALRQQVLDGLIDERVQITYARENGSKVDDTEVDRAVANVAAQNQISVAELRNRLKAEGMDLARFRSTLRDQLMVERLREREVNARIRVTDAEIDRAIEEQKAKLAGNAQLNIAQILVTVPEGAAPDVLAQRQLKAEQALARARAGEDFSKLALALSEDAKREAGGEIGLRPADRLPDLFVGSVKALAPGQVADKLVRSGAGFHVLKLIDRQGGDLYKTTQTRARHILLRTSERAQPQAVGQRLAALRQQIERGEKKFEDVAKEISEDGSAASGGDLGWASPGMFVPEFEEAMNRLADGGISPPVVSRYGVHLIQVLERRGTSLDPKEVREQVRNQLREGKFEQAFFDWVKEIRLRAYIEMREPPL